MSRVLAAGSPTPGRAIAGIDWVRGRVVGYAVPQSELVAFEVVHLFLGGRKVASVIANYSVFDLARDLVGQALPAREFSGFELRIPQGALLATDLAAPEARLSVRNAQGEVLFEQALHGLHELLRLCEGTPADLLYDVQFRGVREGAVHGVVIDKHGSGIRPELQVRFNDSRLQPLGIVDVSTDGKVHHFQVPIRTELLGSGANALEIVGGNGQAVARFPIQLGVAVGHDMERRIEALEAQIEFLKHLALTQNNEALPARLALLKTEVIGTCSEMLSLQRLAFEREWQAAQAPGTSSARSGDSFFSRSPKTR
jgi:hypothetical protein